jgi:hypothetical protein
MTTTSGDAAWHESQRQRQRRVFQFRKKKAGAVAMLAAMVLLAHKGFGLPVFSSESVSEPGWEQFRAQYDTGYFGKDGQFVRAVQNGFNLVSNTPKYAPRFTNRTAADRVNSCVSCHTLEGLAYSFVNSDRFNAGLGRRISFEEQIQHCYADHLDGHVPTIYDPAVRDIRLLARAIAHHLQLSEGAIQPESGK